MNRQSSVGWTPLLIACHRGHMTLVNTMLNNHARVDVFDNEGRSALHLAAERGYLQVWKYTTMNILLLYISNTNIHYIIGM